MEFLDTKNRSHFKKYVDDAITWRRHLHRYPELSFEEVKTTAFIKETLDSLSIPYSTVAKTGVIGFIKGNGSTNKTLALRADIDALPIQEANNVSYKSAHDGIMHACGHDFHTSNLLATAAVLKDIENELQGDIILIFQAAEEKIPGGAQGVVRSGILDIENLVGVIGQHVSPQLEVGKFGFRSGPFMASSDEIYIDVLGKGGHGAQPHLNIDPVIVSAQLLLAFQQIVSRYADPRIPTVLSFGKVIANGAANIIPDTVHLAGTLRTYSESWRKGALSRIEEIASGIAESFGVNIALDIKHGYPSLVNNTGLINEIKDIATELFDQASVLEVPLWTAAEDFAYYACQYPSAFYLIGTKNIEKDITSELHTSTFNIDEDILEQGIKLMVHTAVSLLKP